MTAAPTPAATRELKSTLPALAAFRLQRMDNFMELQWHRLVLRLPRPQMLFLRFCATILVAVEINWLGFPPKGPKLLIPDRFNPSSPNGGQIDSRH